MLIKDNFDKQFYDVIKSGHVLLLVGEDVDALCASSILMHLLDCDDVPYSLIPVAGYEQLEKVMHDHQDQSYHIVLINCGGNRPLDELPLPNHGSVFVIDSRRPIELDNVYDSARIRVLVSSQELDELRIPRVEEVYRDDSDDEDDDSDEEKEEVDPETGRVLTRMERAEMRIIKNEQRKLWEKRRSDLLWEYYEYAWYSIASSVRLLELASSLSRSSAELLWLAAVGLNSQWTDRIVSTESYTAVCIDHMRPFINRFAPRAEGNDLLRVTFAKELPLAMYQHWSLYSAMMVDEHFACKTRNWTQKGDVDVKHMLAGLGLTIVETKQKYDALSQERRTEIFDVLNAEMDGSFASFFATVAHCGKVSAADVARALSARLECGLSEPLVDRFASAQQILRTFSDSRKDMRPLMKGVERYKVGLETVWNAVSLAINQAEVLPTSVFCYYASPRVLDNDILRSRHFLTVFTHFLARAYATSGKKKSIAKPLIIAFPLGGTEQGWHLVSGMMPLAADNMHKTFIGRAFEKVCGNSNINARRDSFDPHVILLKSEDRSRFIDHLQGVLTG